MTLNNTRQTHRPSELITQAQEGGQALFSFKKTLSGAAPHTVAFADHGFKNMKNASYRVTVGGEFASGACNVDESTITTQGFSLLGGADTEIAHVWIHGEVEGTPEV
jgi:hypothetical protein